MRLSFYPRNITRLVGALKAVILLQGEYDAIIIPGGLKGAETISQSSLVQSLVKSFHENGKLVGLICAGKGDI